MTVDNEELGRRITDVVRDAETRLARDMGRIEGLLTAHQRDPYAHREMVESYREEKTDWNKWRDGMNNWRAYLTGAIAVIVAIGTIVGVVLAQHLVFK